VDDQRIAIRIEDAHHSADGRREGLKPNLDAVRALADRRMDGQDGDRDAVELGGRRQLALGPRRVGRRQHEIAGEGLLEPLFVRLTGEGFIHGYPIDWDEAHLLVRIDPHWDYDRQRMVPPELEDHVNDNLERQFKHGERIFEFFRNAKLKYPVSLHFIGQRATESSFYVKRMEAVE